MGDDSNSLLERPHPRVRIADAKRTDPPHRFAGGAIMNCSTPPCFLPLSSGVTSTACACPVIFTGGRQLLMQGLAFQNAFSVLSRSSS